MNHLDVPVGAVGAGCAPSRSTENARLPLDGGNRVVVESFGDAGNVQTPDCRGTPTGVVIVAVMEQLTVMPDAFLLNPRTAGSTSGAAQTSPCEHLIEIDVDLRRM